MLSLIQLNSTCTLVQQNIFSCRTKLKDLKTNFSNFSQKEDINFLTFQIASSIYCIASETNFNWVILPRLKNYCKLLEKYSLSKLIPTPHHTYRLSFRVKLQHRINHVGTHRLRQDTLQHPTLLDPVAGPSQDHRTEDENFERWEETPRCAGHDVQANHRRQTVTDWGGDKQEITGWDFHF